MTSFSSFRLIINSFDDESETESQSNNGRTVVVVKGCSGLKRSIINVSFLIVSEISELKQTVICVGKSR